jgi:cytochrome c peroxidase
VKSPVERFGTMLAHGESMNIRRRARTWLRVSAIVVLGVALMGADARFPQYFTARNVDGTAGMLVTGDAVSVNHQFFRSLGTNGRTCATCHVPTEGWSITPAGVRARFDDTEGRAPLFRPNDGTTSPRADVSTLRARRAAYALLLSKGLIRVGLPVPAGADFTLESADDPYGFASATELSLFRRPLPATNLAFLSTVMWDGRETFPGRTMMFNLKDQANAATVGHAQGAPLTSSVRRSIALFELRLFTAQVADEAARGLLAAGAEGGPRALSTEPYWPGINSDQDPTGAPPTPLVFTLFDAWATAGGPAGAARQAVARGQQIFNTRTFTVRASTCSSCHNAPNAGSNSKALLFDVGVSAADLRTPDLPLYTFRCVSGPPRVTTDPGLALISGRCQDIGKFKVPVLRGLATRRPYFHNGSAATLDDVVAFYDQRFGIGLTPEERADLVAFLRAL